MQSGGMSLLDLLIEVAFNVKKSVEKALKRPDAKEVKCIGAGGDATKKIDLIAEKTALRTLKKSGFKGVVISEEAGYVKMGDEKYVILLDPLDGTTNAIKGIRFYAVSIALAKEQRLSTVESAVVLDLGGNNLYTAEKGSGAYLNFKPVKTSSVKKLEEAVLGVDLSGKVAVTTAERATKLCALTKHVRHLGAVALELCLIACGALDAYVDFRNLIRPIDIAAGKLILEEAGGTVVDLNGRSLDAVVDVRNRLSFIACSTKELCFEIFKAIGV